MSTLHILVIADDDATMFNDYTPLWSHLKKDDNQLVIHRFDKIFKRFFNEYKYNRPCDLQSMPLYMDMCTFYMNNFYPEFDHVFIIAPECSNIKNIHEMLDYFGGDSTAEQSAPSLTTPSTNA